MIIIYWQQVGIQYIITSDLQNKKDGQMDTDLLYLCTVLVCVEWVTVNGIV